MLEEMDRLKVYFLLFDVVLHVCAEAEIGKLGHKLFFYHFKLLTGVACLSVKLFKQLTDTILNFSVTVTFRH